MRKVPADQRQRRTTEEVREAILDAATRLFGEKGFEGVTTRELAQAAHVSETMIYRAFSSKQGLYDAAVRAPLDRFSVAFTDHWLHDPEATAEATLGEFARGLYAMVREHRLVFSALSGHEYLAAAADAPLTEVEHLAEQFKRRFGLRWDAKIASRGALTLVVGMALLEDVYYLDGGRPSEARIVEELTAMLMGAAGLERPRA